MAAAANFAFANRQMMLHEVRLGFEQVFGRPWERLGVELLYDVAHNIAKLETHDVDGACRHSSGCTARARRAPSAPGIPTCRRSTADGPAGDHPRRHGHRELAARGHRDGDGARASARPCHGAGRRLSRGAAKQVMSGAEVRRELEAQGIVVRAQSTSAARRGGAVRLQGRARSRRRVDAVGLARKVARLKPLGVLKG